jgi:hypothetical protein
MKFACISLGRRFEVITSSKGYGYQCKVVFDLNNWLKLGKWQTDLRYSKVLNSSSFTIIKISKLYQHKLQLVELKKDIVERFALFLGNRQIKVRINGELCDKNRMKIN